MNIVGQIKFTDGVIQIADGIDRQCAAEVLLHEILHAVYLYNGVVAKQSEEHVVQQMSIGLAGVIRQNPDAFVWIARSMK